MKSRFNKLNFIKITVICIIVILFIVIYKYYDYIKISNIKKLIIFIDQYKIFAPIIYLALFVLSSLFFMPVLPFVILAGLVFGPLIGFILAGIGTILASSLLFVIPRYVIRSSVENWINENDKIKKIDRGVKKHGWRMVVITRTVPFFPFNLQNFAYGLTDIRYSTYIIITGVCMIPCNIIYTFFGYSILNGQMNVKKIFMYIGIVSIIFVISSLIPKWVNRKVDIHLKNL